jgi:hypothetical protein
MTPTPFFGWTLPAEGTDPWYAAFQTLANQIDQTVASIAGVQGQLFQTVLVGSATTPPGGVQFPIGPVILSVAPTGIVGGPVTVPPVTGVGLEFWIAGTTYTSSPPQWQKFEVWLIPNSLRVAVAQRFIGVGYRHAEWFGYGKTAAVVPGQTYSAWIAVSTSSGAGWFDRNDRIAFWARPTY